VGNYGAGPYGAGNYGIGGRYSFAARDAALHAARRVLGFRFEVYDDTGLLRADVSPSVLAASIEYNTEAQIRRTARFTFADTSAINWLSDQIKPFVQFLMPDGFWLEYPCGVFVLSSPSRKESGGFVTREVAAYDRAQILVDSKVTTLTAYSGNYIGAVASILADAGITDMNLTATTLSMPVTLDWEAGTPRLKIINDLLAKINYRPLYFDANGFARAVPFVDPSSRPADRSYADDALSIVAQGAEQQLDLFGVPNQIVGVVSQPDRAVLTSAYTNTSAGSPTSTVNRGRTIVQFENNLDAPDQPTLDAIVFQHAWAASQVYEEIHFDTGIMPLHGDLDVLEFVHSVLGTSGNYLEVAWGFNLAAGELMHHTARKTVSI
jgi:hypothetical protein